MTGRKHGRPNYSAFQVQSRRCRPTRKRIGAAGLSSSHRMHLHRGRVGISQRPDNLCVRIMSGISDPPFGIYDEAADIDVEQMRRIIGSFAARNPLPRFTSTQCLYMGRGAGKAMRFWQTIFDEMCVRPRPLPRHVKQLNLAAQEAVILPWKCPKSAPLFRTDAV